MLAIEVLLFRRHEERSPPKNWGERHQLRNLGFYKKARLGTRRPVRRRCAIALISSCSQSPISSIPKVTYSLSFI